METIHLFTYLYVSLCHILQVNSELTDQTDAFLQAFKVANISTNDDEDDEDDEEGSDKANTGGDGDFWKKVMNRMYFAP